MKKINNFDQKVICYALDRLLAYWNKNRENETEIDREQLIDTIERFSDYRKELRGAVLEKKEQEK